MIELKSYAAKTDQGPYLQVNEDDLSVDLVSKLFMVYDGFGGSGVGDKAVDLVKETILKFYTKIGGDPDSTLPFYYSHKYLLEGNALINSMYYAHEVLKKQNMERSMNERGGVASVCCSLAENVLTIASTGNCLALLYRMGKITPLLTPDNHEFYVKDFYHRHFYTAPVSGFGLFDELHLEVREAKAQKGDVYLLLTDGVYSRVDLKEIKYNLDKSISDQEKLEDLFEMANQRGNLDNQTGLILNF